jgi:hypothetical protein
MAAPRNSSFSQPQHLDWQEGVTAFDQLNARMAKVCADADAMFDELYRRTNRDLDALAALVGTGLYVKTGSGTAALRTLVAGANVAITDGDGVAGNPTIAVTGIGSTIEAWDADLDALAALSSTGIAVRTASNTWSLRTLVAGTGIALTNAAGILGDITVAVTGILSAIVSLASTGLIARTGAGTVSVRTITAGANVGVTNGDGVSGNPTIAVTGIGSTIEAWDADLDALAGISTAGLLARTGAGTAAARTLTAGANVNVTNGDGVSGNPTIAVTGIGSTLEAWDADLDAVAALSSTGIAVRTAANTWSLRTLVAGTGIALTNAAGVLGDITVAVTGILSAIVALASTGFISRTGAGTVSVRTLTGDANVQIANGDGVSGNPTFSFLVATSTSTVTGTQNNYAPSVLKGDTVETWGGTSDATFTGIAGGLTGMRYTFRNTGTKVAYFAHLSGSSSGGNKFTNIATSGSTPVAPGGHITYVYDGSTWQLTEHAQGSWINVTFSAGDFTGGGAQTWTVGSGDVVTFAWFLKDRSLFVTWYMNTTTVGGTPNPSLFIAVPNGFSWNQTSLQAMLYNDAGAGVNDGFAQATSAATTIQLLKNAGGNWAAATDTTGQYGTIVGSVT